MVGLTLIGLGIAITALWVAVVAVVFAVRSPGLPVRELLCVLPASLRLAGALYRDRAVPGSVRWRLRIALVYNLQPINLIPDVIPVFGFADNVVVLAWALRSAMKLAGPDVVRRHWRSSPESLAALYRALRLLPRAEVEPA